MQISFVGTGLLYLALSAAGLMAVSGLMPRHSNRALALAGTGATGALVAVATAFFVLMSAYANTDLSLMNVYLNSHTLKPMVYKLTGTWANHEGSLLLWLMVLGVFAGSMAWAGRGSPELRRLALGVQGLLLFAFLLFTILTSSPFEPYPAEWPTPQNGQGLNPLLQDPGLAIHPPTLYVGYVGLSAVFSFTVAALFRGDLGKDWANAVRPFLLVAWSALTLGIGLGGFWAYYELGWGGFWFWDPVENASLMPWLAATALLHCVMVVERRDALKPWCAALAILAFGFSLLGAFLVRSGIVTSVHAFANDPERGVVLLFLTALFTGGAFLLFAIKGSGLVKKEAFEPVSREGALVVNNLLFAVLLFTVFLGTFWPTVVEVSTGSRISVGPPYYNAMAVPLTAMMAVTLAFGLLVPWKVSGRGLWRKPLALIVGASGAIALAFILLTQGTPLAFLGLVSSLIVLGAVFVDLARKAGLPGAGLAEVGRRLGALNRQSWGAVVAHIGLALLIFGVTASTVFQSELRVTLAPGESTEVRRLTLSYDRREPETGRNYIAELDTFTLRDGDRVLAVLNPSRRYYPVADQATTEVAIKRLGLGNFYLASGSGPNLGEARLVRAYVHPMIHLLWSGAVLIAIGGLVAASGGRKKARTTPAPEPSAEPVPA